MKGFLLQKGTFLLENQREKPESLIFGFIQYKTVKLIQPYEHWRKTSLIEANSPLVTVKNQFLKTYRMALGQIRCKLL